MYDNRQAQTAEEALDRVEAALDYIEAADQPFLSHDASVDLGTADTRLRSARDIIQGDIALESADWENIEDQFAIILDAVMEIQTELDKIDHPTKDTDQLLAELQPAVPNYHETATTIEGLADEAMRSASDVEEM